MVCTSDENFKKQTEDPEMFTVKNVEYFSRIWRVADAEKTEEMFKNRVENAEEFTFCGDLFILKETLNNHIFSVQIDA